MAKQENVDEKEIRLAVDLYVCKASKEDLLLVAHKLGIPDEKLDTPEFKLKIVVLDHVGDTLEEKSRIERMSFMKEVLVCLGAERVPPPVVEKDNQRSGSSDEGNKGLHDAVTEDTMSAVGVVHNRINDERVMSGIDRMSLEGNLSTHDSAMNIRSSFFRR